MDDNLYIHADPNMFQTILRNILSNAVKFTKPKGQILVKAITLEEQDKIQFDIIDNGIGISEEEQETIFSISQKQSKLGTDMETGTGLGLILCKEFVQINRGELSIRSKVNEGTCVSFTLPRIRKQ